MVHRLLAAALTLFPLVSPPSLSSQESGYVLRPGDRVTIEVFTAAGVRVDVVSGERILDRDGALHLPYIGSVHASGLNELEVRDLLVAGYSRYYDDPVMTVEVELRVNVTGAVPRPGQYFLDPTATIVDALANAGGAGTEISFNNFQIPADQSQVRLVRDGRTTILNLRPGEATPEVLGMQVRSGDWIHVPPRQRSRFRDEITFWGSVVSFVSSVVALGILLGR